MESRQELQVKEPDVSSKTEKKKRKSKPEIKTNAFQYCYTDETFQKKKKKYKETKQQSHFIPRKSSVAQMLWGYIQTLVLEHLSMQHLFFFFQFVMYGSTYGLQAESA